MIERFLKIKCFREKREIDAVAKRDLSLLFSLLSRKENKKWIFSFLLFSVSTEIASWCTCSFFHHRVKWALFSSMITRIGPISFFYLFRFVFLVHWTMSAILINTFPTSAIDVNSDLLSRVRTIVKFYIWPLLVLFGLTGNFLSILVLTRRRLIRTSTNNYLTILAVFDSCYLIFTLFLNFGSHPTFAQYSFTATISSILRPLADFSSNTATWLIVCFTLERTLAVAKPIYAKRTCSVRRSRRLICTLLIICFLITLPTFFEQSLVRDNHEEEETIPTNTTQSIKRLQQKKFLHNLHRSYLVFICIVIIWIPLLLLCICNSILIW